MLAIAEHTFYNLPKISPEEINKGTIALIGSRIETSSIHKAYGVKNAAEILRRVSVEYVGYIDYKRSIVNDYDVVDLGDFDAEQIGEVVKNVVDRGGIPFVIGGDHATTFFATRYIHFTNLLWLDAHLDMQDLGDYGAARKINHANSLLQIVKHRKNLSVIVAGFRGFSTPKIELSRASKLGITYLSPEEIRGNLRYYLAKAQVISMDLDFFDATEFRSTRVPEINGYKVNEFVHVIANTELRDIKYFDIVEYCPEIDIGFVDAKILVQIIPLIIGRIIDGMF